jgi:hypothetical protein
MSKTNSTTIKLTGNMSREQSDSLRALGFVADVRGGNPITRRARDRYALACNRARHTGYVAIVSKADGSPMTAADLRTVRGAL